LPSRPERLWRFRRLAGGPRVAVTDIEARISSRYTSDTLAFLARRAPGARFVWLMGADNLAQFHRWRRWRAIADLMPIAVVDRPGWTLSATASQAAIALAPFRLAERDAIRFALRRPPALVFLHGRRSELSSTLMRQARPAALCDVGQG